MADQKRERIGPFLITTEKHLAPEGITCAMCGRMLSRYTPGTDTHSPSAEELHKAGMIAIPNFGWFCSHECAVDYERKFNVRFARNSQGKIDYY